MNTLIVITAAIAGLFLFGVAALMLAHGIFGEGLVVAALGAWCWHHVEKRVKPKPRVIPPEFQKYYE